jgi:putative intracellular protease/amidase
MGTCIYLCSYGKTLTIPFSKHTIDFTSPNGPDPEVDEGSVKMFTDDECVKFLQDPEVKQKFASAKKISDVDPKEYDAVFYVGG